MLLFDKEKIIVKEEFNEYLKRKRTEKGYTLQKLSELSGLSYIQLKNLELGKHTPTVLTVSRIAKALGCDYDEMFSKTLD